MFEILGFVYFIIAGLDLIFKTGDVDMHIMLALLFFITSMAIKTHTETVKISNYIGDSKRKMQDTIEYKDRDGDE